MRNTYYWKPGRPYLDAIEWRIMSSQATRILAFVAGEFDLTFVGDVTAPISKQIAMHSPKAICKLGRTNVFHSLIINRDLAPFNDANVRRAMMLLALDRES